MVYDHRSIEERWQKYWEENQSFATVRRPGAPKAYVLDMFPYPSGSGLHVGHVEGYTATDIVARYKRMCGYDVLHPMGWDAFGLPAEQHALATGTHPKQTTLDNIANFRRQLRRLGFSYDWSREVDTTEPGYVRWTQWIFLELYRRGLAFQSEIPVNWCQALGTVLANEEVVDGVSERGGHPVVRKPLRQWQLRITAYADRLAADLEGLDWPETKQKQQDWIGRSEGAEVRFPIVGRSEHLRVFTTRPDTLFGATYVVVAPDHALTLSIASAEQTVAVQEYVARTARKSDLERTSAKEKTGVFTGAYAENPVNGQALPIFTADYVLGSYGTGAIMAVPAHDARDFEFATAFRLPIVQVVSPDGSLSDALSEPFEGDGVAVRSGKFDGLPTAEFKRRIIDHLETSGLGERRVNYKLRDWVFSRQRYWGEPIPIYFPVHTTGDPRRGDPATVDYSQPIACEDSELPLLLPELENYQPGDAQGPLAKALDWRFFQKDGRWYARETNTMPQWAGSCWYYLRFIDPHNSRQMFDPQAYADWMPVDLYVGGSEHAVLHLLYARFWHKVLFDAGLVKDAEPFTKLVHQGMVLGRQFGYHVVRDGSGKVVRALGADVKVVRGKEPGSLVTEGGEAVEAAIAEQVEWRDSKPYHPEYGVLLTAINEKMSKSRGNVVNPDDVMAEYGADSLRLYEMFMGPLQADKPWQTSGIQGVYRFLDRVHTLAPRCTGVHMDQETSKLVHRTVKKVGADFDAMRFNTTVSALMILTNHLAELAEPPREAFEKLLLCLAPLAPHLAEELWQRLGSERGSISRAAWPGYDEALCVDDVVEVPVQVNGKVRGRVVLSSEATEAEAREAALADRGVQLSLEGKTIAKVVYVSKRVLNIVAK
ncbi:MAG TPA: leucine--tRNA ligase [Polyangiaceae bacterium]|nr:leucine--tRNA ligase [Polyangiaceae bacterium]